MRGRDEATWRRRTAQVATGTLAVTGLALLPFAGGLFGDRVFLGLPLATFFAVIAAPVLILIVAAVFAGRQLAIDRHYDVSER